MTPSSAAAPAIMSQTAANTVRGCPGVGRSRIRAAPLSRSTAASRLGRVWSSWAQAISTARTSSVFRSRNHFGYHASSRR